MLHLHLWELRCTRHILVDNLLRPCWSRGGHEPLCSPQGFTCLCLQVGWSVHQHLGLLPLRCTMCTNWMRCDGQRGRWSRHWARLRICHADCGHLAYYTQGYEASMHTVICWRGQFRLEVPPEPVGTDLPKVGVKGGRANVWVPLWILGSLLLAQWSHSINGQPVPIDLMLLPVG